MKENRSLKNENNPLSILENIVSSEMCVGCGLCVAQEGVPDSSMKWNDNGFLVPDFSNLKEVPSKSLSVCPFNPNPEREVRTEDELADYFLNEGTKYYPKLGRIINTYVGYSEKYRLTSSSGGLGTYVLDKLFESNEIDFAFVVSDGLESSFAYQYEVFNNNNNVIRSSKTRYYPVTMAEVFKKLPSIKGKVAIVGIPCFIKAIRLHQYYNPEVGSKIKFLIGIVCGGMKSRFFAEYLAAKSGLDSNEFYKPEFRVKDPDSNALDYSFSCENKIGESYSIKMREVGDMWGTGYFKNNACDFCDDVVAELADISLGDAWIDPYKKDGKGTNVIITRSHLADQIIREGIVNHELNVQELSQSKVVDSQRGGFNHRHRGLFTRIKIAKNKHSIPPKRYDKERAFIDFRMVQKKRMEVRNASIRLWKLRSNLNDFEERLGNELFKLQLYTKLYHKLRRIKDIIFDLRK